ncbi:hypothetical protein H2200_013514 [Cladophialophora chaetospira]|uniref:Copper-fist domain-containing protein n=1 Tax=Cladophialophora chaetospira TaxID=386627 RepID=A0AA38TX98_9EURO|nr:hypothetical protein H2200_013514 [Cladophialophora chaetospira]
MRDPSASTPKTVPSPPKSAARVEDGKVKKLKSSYKNDIPAIQHINGKTYACESCKRGHRVHKCDHGKTRPISETNQPGRPSAGSKRGCHCPRNCACTTKTCKCERDCACTQEMFLVVRLDNPVAISRESTSTPKPVWEDAEGNQLTLKKVWADANGKEIDDEEYQARQRLMKEREDAAKDAPQSSCCSSRQPKKEPDSPKGGCRHLQSMAAIQPHPGPSLLEATPQSQTTKPAPEPWMSTCSCGTGCSCLYCPDHPNNATSINHAQQQVKNIAEQAYAGGNTLTPVPSNTESTSRSCMGGQPSFFLSSTPDVSQHHLQQFFADTLNPNAIYLAYPISQHSWTNRPLSSHCSHVPSPTNVMAMSPNDHDPFTDPLSDMSTPLHLPNDVNGTWNFSDGQLGGTSFSWTGMDASYGTDYSIGQATVASISNIPMPLMQATPMHQTPTMNGGMTSATMDSSLADFPDLPQLDHNPFVDFDLTQPDLNTRTNLFGTESLPTFNVQPARRSCCAPAYDDFDLVDGNQVDSNFNIGGTSRTSSPIVNRV